VEAGSALLVQIQMIASMVHPPHFSLEEHNFLFDMFEIFATLDESSDHTHWFPPL
jgi:hypothetical protein